MTEPIDIRIGLADNNYLLIRVLGRQFPESMDYWDSNWLHVLVWIAAGDFKGEVKNYIRNDELLKFQDELETLYRTLSGKASIFLMENWLSVTLEGNHLGQIAVTGVISDGDYGVSNVLRFAFVLDQTYLPDILKSLSRVQEALPIVGNQFSR